MQIKLIMLLLLLYCDTVHSQFDPTEYNFSSNFITLKNYINMQEKLRADFHFGAQLLFNVSKEQKRKKGKMYERSRVNAKVLPRKL